MPQPLPDPHQQPQLDFDPIPLGQPASAIAPQRLHDRHPHDAGRLRPFPLPRVGDVLIPAALTPGAGGFASSSFDDDTPLLLGVQDLNRRIHEDFKYDPVATTVATPLEEVLQNRRGVCQDFAHIGIACMRSLGLLARYVGGYLRTHPAPGKERLTGADASHAWFSVFCPSVGSVDFDPTNNLLPAEEHITVAYRAGLDDVSPISGILVGGGSHAIKVSVDVREVGEVRA